MALDGADRWPRGAVDRVIGFERALAKAMPTLGSAIARANGYFDPDAYVRLVPSDAPFALVRAIELAFATDQLDLGLKLCHQLVIDEATRPKTPMQFAQWGTIGALLRLVTVRFTPAGIRYRANVDWQDGFSEGTIVVPWPELGSQARLLAQRTLPAAILTGSARQVFNPFFDGDQQAGRRRSTWAFVSTTDEFRVAQGVSGLKLRVDPSVDARAERASARLESLAALGALERNYHARLDAMRATPAWDDLRFRGNLIDWSLLAFYAAGLQKRAPWSKSVEMAGQAQYPRDDLAFLQSLAAAIIRPPGSALG